jgi:NADH-quinone oxidoreductase subunit C
VAEYTDKGTLKRDPNAPKQEPPASPEERAARIAAARAKAEAARAAGGTARPAATAGAAPAGEPAETAPMVEAAPPAADGQLRTAKGTLKRDPNAPKQDPPATPEERAARIAAAKARADAARQAREAGGAVAPAAGGLQPAAAAASAAAARPAGETDADRAERRRIFEIVTRGVPGAEPVLRPVVAARAERAPARGEFALSEAGERTVRLVRAALPDVPMEALSSPLDPVFVIPREDVPEVLRTLRDHEALEMKFLRCITGVDHMDEGVEVVYTLKSMTTKLGCIVKTMLPARDPVVDSVTSLWAGANWLERETAEMFGVTFTGHPDPRNLLLDEDLTIHPLLKAHPLAEVELKQGVNVF